MHIQLFDIILIFLLSSFVYSWWRNITIREYALTQVKKHCKSLDLQLLDQSVAGAGWKPVWHHGQIKIKRIYKFEFSSSGIARYPGKISYIGHQQVEIWMSPHDF